MKQFNLNEYLANSSRKVVTRDGRNVRVLCTDAVSGCPIVALVRNSQGHDAVYQFKIDGRCYDSESNLDLFFEPLSLEGWVNIYHHGALETATCCSTVFPTKEDAEADAHEFSEHYIASIKVNWEELLWNGSNSLI